jgi:hypothetical protein
MVHIDHPAITIGADSRVVPSLTFIISSTTPTPNPLPAAIETRAKFPNLVAVVGAAVWTEIEDARAHDKDILPRHARQADLLRGPPAWYT